MKFSEKIQEKRQKQADVEQSKKDKLILVHYLKEAGVGTPTELLEKLQQVSDSIVASLDKSKTEPVKEVRSQLADFRKLATALVGFQTKQSATLTASLEKLVESVGNRPDVDLSPIVTALNELKIVAPEPNVTVEYIAPSSLADYKAHDIKEDGNTQYIGFVNPDGKWYIIENNTDENKLRYVFGESKYSDAFSDAGKWQYRILSEAMKHEV